MDGMNQHFQREAKLAGAKIPGGGAGSGSGGGAQYDSRFDSPDVDDIGSMIKIERVD